MEFGLIGLGSLLAGQFQKGSHDYTPPTMLAVVPAFAAPADTGPKSTGPGDCTYGVTHAFLARSGLTGSAHIPGLVHKGASGFCEGMPN